MKKATRFKLDPKNSGWIPHKERTAAVKLSYERIMQDAPEFRVVGSEIKGSWDGVTDVRLDHIFAKVSGGNEADIQAIGDCVGHGSARMKGYTLCCDIHIRGEEEEYPGVLQASEWDYGASRVIQGGGRLGGGDGSVGAWVAKVWTDNGSLIRKKYEINGKTYDLTKYDGRRAKDWGGRKFPYELEVIADEHPTSGLFVPVLDFDNAADLLDNGYSFIVCSNQGFDDTRDKDGFLTPRGTWNHCMVAFGVKAGREGIGLDNKSWPDCFRGPNPDNVPSSCGWVDRKTWNRMLGQRDSFAAPGYEGFKKTTIDWSLF